MELKELYERGENLTSTSTEGDFLILQTPELNIIEDKETYSLNRIVYPNNIEGLTIAGFNRSNLFKNISLPFKLFKSFIHKYIYLSILGYYSYSVIR